MNAQQFRKNPVVIEAMQFDGSIASAAAICQWANAGDAAAGHDDPTVSYITYDGDAVNAHDMVIWTLEGDMTASPGDWIIRGVQGEFYPCKPDIFSATYEPAAIAALSAEGGDKPVARVYVTEDDYDIEWLRPYSTGFLYDRPAPAAAATGDVSAVDAALTAYNRADLAWTQALDRGDTPDLEPRHRFAMRAAIKAAAVAADSERLDFVQRNRVGLVPEFEGQWDAEVYGEDAVPRVFGGNTPRDAIDAAMIAAAQQEPAPYQEEEQVCDCGHPEAEWSRRQHSADCGLHNTAED